jgi:hypothetical protein
MQVVYSYMQLIDLRTASILSEGISDIMKVAGDKLDICRFFIGKWLGYKKGITFREVLFDLIGQKCLLDSLSPEWEETSLEYIFSPGLR